MKDVIMESDSDDDEISELKKQKMESLQNKYERLDSRGKKILIRRIGLQHEIRYCDPELQDYVYSYAKVNLDPSTYLSTQELKARATSFAHYQYKNEKREIQRIQQKKRYFWFVSIVKCIVFVKKIKKKWMLSKL